MPDTLSQQTALDGRYVIQRELRRAGVAIVYLARDLRTERAVALKVLRPELAAALGTDRVVEAIKATKGLEHPNILPLIDVGFADGVVYFVTPHVEGETLRERLERDRQLPIDESLRIAGGVASALEFAHRRGIVHGDVKPEKILLHDGQPLVADFGLALGLAGAAREQSVEAGVFGTPAYMSPEQAVGGRAVDGWSDQYSLASVLYEMLAGEPPYSAPSVPALIARVLNEPPPRLTAVRVVPRIIERAIHRALSKAPADRFDTVTEFMAALHGASATPALPSADPAPTTARGRTRWRVVVGASLVVLMVAAGVAMGSRVVLNRRATPPTPAAHRQLTFTGAATSPDLSPDGRSVAYVAGGRALIVQRLDGGAPVRVVPSARSISAARWTGDGRALVVTMTRDSTEAAATYLVSASGGPARKVVDEARPFDAGADSTTIVRAPRDGGRLEIVSLASGRPVRRITLPDSIGAVTEVVWSPDRRWLAFTGAGDALWVVAAGGGSPSRVAEGARKIRWAAGSDSVYYLAGPTGAVDLLRVGIDPQSGSAVGRAARVTALLAADAFDVGLNRLVHTQTSPSAQARTFVLGGAPLRRVVEERPLDGGTVRVSAAAVSPDGQWIAYTATRGAERDIHAVAFGGGSARVVASSRAREESPTWSPDGTRLTFAREDSAGRRLVMADARTGAAQRVGSLPGPGTSAGDAVGPRSGAAAARWSASGRHIAYYAQDLRRIALVNLQRRTESAVRVPDSAGTGYFSVVPSPNGTQLLASTIAPRDERATLWLVFGNGRRWRRIRGPHGETLPVAWHRNGWVYLVRNRALATDHGSVHLELWRMRGPLGRPELYAPLPEGCGMAVSISADATRGVCSYVRVESDLYVAGSVGAASGR